MAIVLTANDVVGFNCNLSMAGAPTATVILDNNSGQLSLDTNSMLGHVLQVTVERGATTYPLLTGRIRSVKPTYTTKGDQQVEVTLSSVTEPLTKRPVVTETVENVDGGALMLYLLDDYGGLDRAFIDIPLFHGGEIFSDIFISEDSLLSGVRKVAEACNIEVFVGPDGILTTEEKKTSLSAVDHTLEREDLSATVTEHEEDIDMVTVARVRGRWITKKAEVILIAQSVALQAIPENKSKMIVSVVPSSPISRSQAENANVTGLVGATSGKVIGFDLNGHLLIELSGSFTVGEPNDVSFNLHGTPDFVEDGASPIIGDEALGAGGKLERWGPGTEQVRMRLRKAAAAPKGGQVARQMNESSVARLEIVTQHPASVVTFGVRYTEIDNLYIQDEIQAEVIGQRVLLEHRMGSRVLTASGPWIPELRSVNKVVNVPIGYTGVTVKCLLIGLDVRFTNSPFNLDSSYQFVRLVT